MHTKPKPSLLDCQKYFVSDLTLLANRDFDHTKPISLEWTDLDIESSVVDAGGEGRGWQVTLFIRQDVGIDKNSPYNFSVELVGRFRLEPVRGVKVNDPEKFVRINGSSLLYGVAREVIRNLTALGPFVPLLLPTVSFCDSAEMSDKKVAAVVSSDGGSSVDIPRKVSKTSRKKTKAKASD